MILKKKNKKNSLVLYIPGTLRHVKQKLHTSRAALRFVSNLSSADRYKRLEYSEKKETERVGIERLFLFCKIE